MTIKRTRRLYISTLKTNMIEEVGLEFKLKKNRGNKKLPLGRNKT